MTPGQVTKQLDPCSSHQLKLAVLALRGVTRAPSFAKASGVNKPLRVAVDVKRTGALLVLNREMSIDESL